MALEQDKLTRYTAWVFGEGAIAYMGAVSFLTPNPDPLVFVRDTDGEALWEINDPQKNGRNVAVGPDGEIAVAYRITGGSGSDPEAHQYVLLHDREGVLLWSSLVFDAGEYPIEPAGASVRQMACDPDGNVFYVYGIGFETRFGKLDNITGAILFLQKDYDFNGDVPASPDALNSGCTGICCDPDGDVIFTYASDAGERKIKKRSGATGTSLWEVTGANVHHSPRCDGDGNVFVSELIAPGARIKKLNGATGATLLQSAILPLASGQVLSIDDDNNLVWFYYATGGSAGLKLNTLQAVPSAVITDPTSQVASAVDGTIYVIRPAPASVSGYQFNGEAYVEEWRVTHDIEFGSIGPFAQRFIGDVS